MFCDKCGSKIEDGCLFCEQCGNRVGEVQNAAPQMPYEAPAQQEASIQQEAAPIQQEAAPVQQEAAPVQQEAAHIQQEAASVQQDNNINSKRFPVKWLIIGACGALVVALVLVLLLSKTVKNKINKATKTEEEYYQYVESESVKALSSAVFTAYKAESRMIEELTASKYSFSIDYELRNPKAEILEKFGDSFTDIDWLKKASANFDVILDDKKGELKGDLQINKEKMIDFDVIADIGKGVLYAGLPMLNEKYIYADIDSWVNAEEVFSKLDTKEISKLMPDADKVKIIDKYIDIVLGQMDKISTTESSVSAGGVSQDCDKITVSLNEKVQKNIIKAVAEEVKKDPDIKAILKDWEKSDYLNSNGDDIYDQFVDAIDKAIDEIDDNNYYDYKMNVFIDSKGQVIGRELKDNNGVSRFYYAYAIDGNEFGFKGYIGDYSGEKQSEITISNASISGGKISGTVKIYSYGEELTRFELKNFDLGKLKKGNISGSVIFDLYKLIGEKELKGLSISMNLDCADDDSSVEIELIENEISVAAVTFSASRKSASGISEPSGKIEVDLYNPKSDLSDWFDGFDWKKVREAAKKAQLPEGILDIIDSLEDSDISKILSGNTLRSFRY